MTNKPSSLRIIICGAGIAGLAAAAALATHHQVIVLERKEELTEVSYAINLKPNAAHAAYGVVGLDPCKVRGLPCREIIERDAANGDIKMHKPVDAPADFGGPWYFCQRTELHAELLATAKARGAKVILGTEIEDVNATHGVVLIKGGDAMVADMVLSEYSLYPVLRRHSRMHIDLCMRAVSKLPTGFPHASAKGFFNRKPTTDGTRIRSLFVPLSQQSASETNQNSNGLLNKSREGCTFGQPKNSEWWVTAISSAARYCRLSLISLYFPAGRLPLS